MQNSETESPLANLAATVDGFRQYVNSNHAANSVKDIAKYYRPEDDPNSEYVQLVRNHTKTEIKSITGRMFEVLNEYEDATARDSTYMKGYISDLNVQLEDMEDPTVKANIQLLITDYKELCTERESLLYSLQEWFEQKHIEDSDLPDMHKRRGSVMDSARLENYHQTLQEGREASIRLRGVQDQMEDATIRGDDVDMYKQEKQRLETDLVKSKLAIDDLENEPDTFSAKLLEKGGVDYFINQSWKNAAADICSMLKRVRKSGLMDVQEMEEKLQGMTEAMNEQDKKLATFNEEQNQYKKNISMSEERASDLASENGFLREEVDRIRTDLYDSKKMMATIERQHVRDQKEMARTNTEATNELKQQITSLNKENGLLKGEIASLNLVLESYSTARKTNGIKSSKTNGKSTVVLTTGNTKPTIPQVTETPISNSTPPASGTNNDAILRLKDQLLEERDKDVKRLQKQLESDSTATRDLNNRLTVITNENGTLRTKIAELEMTIATITTDIHQISMASPSLPIDHDKVVVTSNTPRAPPPTPVSHTHFTSNLNNDGITSNVHIQDSQGMHYSGITKDTTQSAQNGNQSKSGGLENGNQPRQNGKRQPIQNGNQPVQNRDKSLYQSFQNGNRIVQNGNRTVQNGNQSFQTGNQPVQNGNRTVQNGNQSFQTGNQPVQNRSQSVNHMNQTVQNGNQTIQNGNQPAVQNGNQTVQIRNHTVHSGNQTAQNRVFTMVQQPTVQFKQTSRSSDQTIIEEVELVDDYGNTLITPTNYGGTCYLNTGGGATTPTVMYHTPPSPLPVPPSPLPTSYPLPTNAQQYIVVSNEEAESLSHESGYLGSNAMPAPRSTLPKPERSTDDAALDIVVGLMEKLNKGGRTEEMGEGNSSTAMRNINTEMNKMVEYIQSFMKDSLNLVDNEVESMSKATNHLLSNLTEREKLEAERKAYQALEDHELDRKLIREKVLKFGQDAIKVLRAGEAVVQSHVVSEQTKLSSVVSVMAEHKKRQPKNFRFPLPGKSRFLETQSTRPHPLISSDTTISRIEAIIKMAEERGTPLTTGNVSVMRGAQQDGDSDLHVTTRATPMLPHKGQNHRNKRTDTSNGLAAQQGKDSKVFNPFKSRTPTWGFLQNKPVQNVTPPPAGATGGTKRGYDKRTFRPSTEAVPQGGIGMDINGRRAAVTGTEHTISNRRC